MMATEALHTCGFWPRAFVADARNCVHGSLTGIAQKGQSPVVMLLRGCPAGVEFEASSLGGSLSFRQWIVVL